ncbi:MAG: hypothetical protein R3F02_20085 [Thiolinea sp.]
MPPEAAKLHNKQQEEQEQLVWERLQREALAAQRDRLEQEMQQAREQGLLLAGSSRHEPFMGINWNYRWVLTGIVLLMVGGVVLEYLFFS